MNTLEADWHRRCITRPDTEITEIVRRGADQGAVEAGLVAIVDIVPKSGRTFAFAGDGESGERTMVVAVRRDPDADRAPWITPDPCGLVLRGALIGVVAALSSRRLLTLLGAADVPGCIGPQLTGPPPTPVWRSERSWLRAGCVGIILVDPCPSVRQRALLSLGGPIIAEDSAHAAELRALIAAPMGNPPKVIVAGTRERTVAA